MRADTKGGKASLKYATAHARDQTWDKNRVMPFRTLVTRSVSECEASGHWEVDLLVDSQALKE